VGPGLLRATPERTRVNPGRPLITVWESSRANHAVRGPGALRQKVEKDAASPAILVTEAGGYKLVP